jgi:hypothetical protein
LNDSSKRESIARDKGRIDKAPKEAYRCEFATIYRFGNDEPRDLDSSNPLKEGPRRHSDLPWSEADLC